MKKSKIIVPALGIILLSTVASVTGTVAWFTANTKYHTDVSQFEVARLQGDLTCDLFAGVGTTKASDAIQVNANTKFTDASYNYEDMNMYEPNDRDTATGADFAAKGLSTETGAWTVDTVGGITYKYGVTFNMRFKYSFGSVTGTKNLFLDTATSTSAFSGSASGSATKDSIKGLRMMFETATIGGTDASPTFTISEGRKVVWADREATTDVKYIGNTGTSEAPVYGPKSYPESIGVVTSDNKSSLVGNKDTSKANFLGSFTTATANDAKTLGFTVTVWFEGTSPDIINDTKMYQIAAAMHFYVENPS